MSDDLYAEIVEVARPFLGPAAARFVEKHIEQVTGDRRMVFPRDLAAVIDGCSQSAARVMDAGRAADFAEKLGSLRERHPEQTARRLASPRQVAGEEGDGPRLRFGSSNRMQPGSA